jgi:hypothetical protein
VRRQNEREGLGASGSDSAAEVHQRHDERLHEPPAARDEGRAARDWARAARNEGRAHALLQPKPPVLDEYDRDEQDRSVPHEHQTSIMTEDGEIQDVEWHGDTDGEEREGEEAPEPYALDSNSSDSQQEECEMEGEGGGGGRWRGWEAGGWHTEPVPSGEESYLRGRLPRLAPLLAPVLMDTLPSPWPSFSHMPLGGGTAQDIPITNTAPDMRISTTRLPKAPPLLCQSGVSSGSTGSPLRAVLPNTPTGLSNPSIPPPFSTSTSLFASP